MTFHTGVGSLPGADAVDYDESVRIVLGEVVHPAGVPFLPELPGRGVTAGMLGRALALVHEIGVDLQPAGWRLTGAPSTSGVDHRRARSLLAQDLDALEEQAQGLTGAFKVQVAGPWTLAACVEKPRGDKVLADVGARRDLAQALAEGVREHVADVRRRLPDVERLVVQVDEPALAAVAAGRITTASGFGRHRTVHPPELSESLGWVLDAVADRGSEAGVEPWVHACAPDTPLDLVRGAGARGLVVDLDVVDAAGHDALGTALEAGETVVLGVVPSLDTAGLDDARVTERVLRWLDLLGLDPDPATGVGERLGVTTACGTAGATPTWARRTLDVARTVAGRL